MEVAKTTPPDWETLMGTNPSAAFENVEDAKAYLRSGSLLANETPVTGMTLISENPLCTVARAQVWSHESCHSSCAGIIPLHSPLYMMRCVRRYSTVLDLSSTVWASAEKDRREQESNARPRFAKSA
jgi:hypothetical protein